MSHNQGKQYPNYTFMSRNPGADLGNEKEGGRGHDPPQSKMLKLIIFMAYLNTVHSKV